MKHGGRERNRAGRDGAHATSHGCFHDLEKGRCGSGRRRLFIYCFCLFQYDIIQKQILKAERKWLSFAKR